MLLNSWYISCTFHGGFNAYYIYSHECNCTLFYYISVCYYQVHHHVHGADFVWVHLVEHLLHLLKCWPHGDVMRPALLNKLFQRGEQRLIL